MTPTPPLIADDNEFQTRVAFFGDLDVDDRLKIISVRREIVEAQLANLAALRPDTEAYPWGLRGWTSPSSATSTS